MTNSYVLGVIVTFYPNASQLKALVEAIYGQIDELLIVDNASPNFPDDLFCEQLLPYLTVIKNNTNVGLSAAYNYGILEAQKRGASHLLLFDQDSLPAVDMIKHLQEELLPRNKQSLVVAAAGPKYADVKGQQSSPFVKIKGLHLERVACDYNEVVEVDHLISSGSLIDMRAFEIVGLFTEELFIDYIDTEWCLRARKNSLSILGVGRAAMKHNIGDASLNVLGRQLPLHSHIRLYYQFRNQIWLITQPWVGWQWRIIDGIRCVKLMIVFVLFAPNKRKNIRYMVKGIWDGILSRMGRLESN